MRTISALLAILVVVGTIRAETTPKEMVDAVVARPDRGQNYPVLPALPTELRFKIMNQLAQSKPVREAYAKLDARQRNVSWFQGISELEKQKAVWPLLSALCHYSEDTQIHALRSIRRLGDKQAVPFLLVYADYMAVGEEGSENATIHGIIHTEIAKTLSSLTGIKVEVKGQDVDGLKKGIHLWKKWQIQEDTTVSSKGYTSQLVDAVHQKNWERVEELQGILIADGGDAVPALVDALEEGDRSVIHVIALTLERIGPEARSAVVPLAKKGTQQCLRAIGRIGLVEANEAVPVLLVHLDDENKRLEAASLIGEYGAGARSAVPALIDHLKKNGDSFSHWPFTCNLLTALGKIGPEARDSVPLLLELLDTKPPHERRLHAHVIGVMGRIGPDAKAAVPRLMKHVHRESPHDTTTLAAVEKITGRKFGQGDQGIQNAQSWWRDEGHTRDWESGAGVRQDAQPRAERDAEDRAR